MNPRCLVQAKVDGRDATLAFLTAGPEMEFAASPETAARVKISYDDGKSVDFVTLNKSEKRHETL